MRVFFACVIVAVVAAGHTVATPAAAVGMVAVAHQEASAPAFEVDYERSFLVAKVKKGGLLRFLGHEHGVVSSSWSADVRFDEENLEGSSIVVEVRAPDLVIDTAEARRLAGVDPDGPGEEDVVEIQGRMLSDEQLNAENFPAIRFESSTLSLRSNNEQLRIDGTLTLRGVSRAVRVDAELAPNGSGYVVRGEVGIKQKEFGIEPVSIGGVVKVADEVEIRFEVHASRTSVAHH